MDLAEARQIVRKSMLNDDTGTSDDEHVDRALLAVLEDFMIEVRPTVVTGTVALTATSATVNMQGTFRLRPERLIRFEVRKFNWRTDEPGRELEHQDYAAVARWIRKGTVASTTAEPQRYAFRQPDLTFLDAQPGTTYPDASFTFYDSLKRWTPGTATAGTSVTLNIPDEYLSYPLWYGAAAMVQHRDQGQVYTSESWQKYVEYRERMKQQVRFDSGLIVSDEDAYL